MGMIRSRAFKQAGGGAKKRQAGACARVRVRPRRNSAAAAPRQPAQYFPFE